MAESKIASSVDLKTYDGNCHCGAFKFTVKIPELREVFVCNCSACSRTGRKFINIQPEHSLNIERGENALKEYQFASKKISLKFCGNCGTAVFAQYRIKPENWSGIMLNVRTLLDIDLWSLNTKLQDSRSSDPPFVPHPFTGPAPLAAATIPNAKTYSGSCHCGAITLALSTHGPLPEAIAAEEDDILECDCSICTRNGTILTYPKPEQVSISINKEGALSQYSFGRKFQTHDFCGICGVAIRLNKLDVGEERWKTEHPKAPYAKHLAVAPLNLRVFEGVEWDQIVAPKGTWSRWGQKYVCPNPAE